MNDFELLIDFNINLFRLIAPVFKEEGYTFNEIAAMWKIMKKGPCRPADLMQGTYIPASTFTSIFDRLEARGLVSRENDPNDRRSFLITGTPQLFAAFQGIIAKCNEKLGEKFSELPAETIRNFNDGLSKVNSLITTKPVQKDAAYER